MEQCGNSKDFLLILSWPIWALESASVLFGYTWAQLPSEMDLVFNNQCFMFSVVCPISGDTTGIYAAKSQSRVLTVK